MPTIPIIYQYVMSSDAIGSDKTETFSFQLNTETLETEILPPSPIPNWVKLDCHQCKECPYSPKDVPACPVAVKLNSVVSRFDSLMSHDTVILRVDGFDRITTQKTAAQRALSSMIGFLIATSGCPMTNFLKPMARLHQPLSTEDDTIFRATGMYLIAQYFLKNQNKPYDKGFEGLKHLYESLHELNIAIAKRLRDTTKSDTSINAIVLLDLLANTLPMVIDDKLDDIKHWFNPYFTKRFQHIITSIHEDQKVDLTNSNRG